ncbi:E3 ubiquitin-protein ligase RNF138-like [Centruroides vittatus]|uniref:E3 ubiquitin-protein ligase RNF138-like n=1 Tax=Centruroides vittatus TaxID=120091 RepID=UPI0035103D3A
MAVEEIKGLASSIRKTLECPICLELLNNPVSTSCNHRFCRNCIITALNEKFKVPCPLCKAKVTKRQLQNKTQLSEVILVVERLLQAVQEDTQNAEKSLNISLMCFTKNEDISKVSNSSKRKRLKEATDEKMTKISKVTLDNKSVSRNKMNNKIYIDDESSNTDNDTTMSANVNTRSAIKRLTRRTNFFTIEKYLDKSLKVSKLERKKITDDQDEKSSRTLRSTQVSLTINSENTVSREYSNQSNIQEKIRLEIQQMKEQIRQMEIQLQTSVCENENKSLNAQTEEETVVTSDSEEGSDDLFSPIPPTPP